MNFVNTVKYMLTFMSSVY